MKAKIEAHTRILSILAFAGALMPAGVYAAAPEQEDSSKIEVGAQDVMKRDLDLKRKVALENKTAGEKFRTENKTKEGVVTLESGLQYKILKSADGKKPTADDTVGVNYRGTFINGTEFDSSYKRNEPSTFTVKRVIKGWSEALQLMPVGSKWQLVIPPELAYGERGAGRKIGPNYTLVFEVELVAIKDNDGKQDKVSAAADAVAKQAGQEKSAIAPALAAINVSFKLDTRLTKSLYMGERWVSPPNYSRSQDGAAMIVEARASGLDGKGRPTNIRPTWIPADPEMVVVSPPQGNEVTITVKATHARGNAADPLVVEISQ